MTPTPDDTGGAAPAARRVIQRMTINFFEVARTAFFSKWLSDAKSTKYLYHVAISTDVLSLSLSSTRRSCAAGLQRMTKRYEEVHRASPLTE